VEATSTLFLGTSITAYGLSTWLAARALRLPSARASAWARHALIVGIIIHVVLVAGRWALTGTPPVGDLSGVLLVCGLLLVLGYLVIAGVWRLSALVIYLLPIAMGALLMALLARAEPRPFPEILWSIWLPVHAGSAFLAYAGFTLAAVLAIAYLIQDHRLRQRGPSRQLAHLPALAVTEAAAYRCVLVGYPLISLALVTGAVWADQVWGAAWTWDPKQLMALATWLVYTAYLRVRLQPAWAGRRSAWLLIGGLVCTLITFLGVNLLGVTTHSFSVP
jgi:cytochrome c-type biogenesis protein CcsB